MHSAPRLRRYAYVLRGNHNITALSWNCLALMRCKRSHCRVPFDASAMHPCAIDCDRYGIPRKIAASIRRFFGAYLAVLCLKNRKGSEHSRVANPAVQPNRRNCAKPLGFGGLLHHATVADLPCATQQSHIQLCTMPPSACMKRPKSGKAPQTLNTDVTRTWMQRVHYSSILFPHVVDVLSRL
ncbi:hypothetical protein BGLCM_0097 [Bifidobacterium gallicum DSM 20093 = LMG 11596]|uniref:Uncharacterized protein n=1 Tax=Bifidobacterium gallicum DSM 20093 = LMG 11596 TaxID=561180 RepID=A0A087AMS7_9BIFI|nr:hypothetical protein BGLCM_0097 [Bifidobacterium gallicum DSM 20093 = LMG 11596]